MVLSCAALRPPEAKLPPPPREIPAPLSRLGQLEVFVTSQMTDGRNILLRGLVRNPYPQTVEGIRVVFRMLSAPGPGARELDRAQKVMESRLAGGEQTALRLDVQTMYAGASGTGFLVQAYAIKRGDEELPLPPDWKE